MRYFFLMLVFLLVSFGLTFSVLMSPISSEKQHLSLVSAVADRAGEVAGSEVQVFGSLEVRHLVTWFRKLRTRRVAVGTKTARSACLQVVADRCLLCVHVRLSSTKPLP